MKSIWEFVLIVMCLLNAVYPISVNTNLNSMILSNDDDLSQLTNINMNRERCSNESSRHSFAEENTCPNTFDGILCWDKYEANKWSYQPCPSWFIGFLNPNGNAKRFCQPNGQWALKKDKHGKHTNNSYTDYTDCIESNDTVLYLKHLPIVKLIGKIGFTLSLSSLIVAIILLISLR